MTIVFEHGINISILANSSFKLIRFSLYIQAKRNEAIKVHKNYIKNIIYFLD